MGGGRGVRGSICRLERARTGGAGGPKCDLGPERWVFHVKHRASVRACRTSAEAARSWPRGSWAPAAGGLHGAAGTGRRPGGHRIALPAMVLGCGPSVSRETLEADGARCSARDLEPIPITLWLRPAASAVVGVRLHRQCCTLTASPSLPTTDSLGLGPTRGYSDRLLGHACAWGAPRASRSAPTVWPFHVKRRGAGQQVSVTWREARARLPRTRWQAIVQRAGRTPQARLALDPLGAGHNRECSQAPGERGPLAIGCRRLAPNDEDGNWRAYSRLDRGRGGRIMGL